MKEFLEHFFIEFELPLSNPVLIFSLILFIILLSPVLLRKLHIPGIIGLILSGVVIGPFGLNILEQNSAIDLFSTIGLLYIMFIAGLELDMNEFKVNQGKSLLFGFFTFAMPLVIGFPVCYYFLDYDFNASFLTASMFATHTLVAYPIVSKLGVSKDQAVAVTVGGTILTDTAVLLILAVILGNSKGELNQDFWYRLGISLLIFSLIMVFVVPKIAAWFFRKFESEKHSHYIFVLSVVFFAAFLAEVGGVEPIIGAFVAGLALNKLIPQSSVLMNRIEFIGNSLFIPFFLISVGMLVDVSVILRGPTALIVAGTLSVVALFGKWIAAWFTQLVFRYTKAQRQLIFGLSSAHAAATLAVILVGFNANILDENILNGTIILILITCIVASFVTENAARSIMISMGDQDENLRRSKGLSNERILLPIANIENIEKLLEFSLLIKEKESDNPVSVLSVVSNNEEAEVNILLAKSRLEEFVRQASASDNKVDIIATIDHNAASGIARAAREVMATIIVLGWPKRTGLLDKFIGDTVNSVLGNTEKTIFIGYFNNPLILHKRIIVVAPPLAERESGSSLWFSKIVKLAQELSIPILFYCDSITGNAIEMQAKKGRLTAAISINYFDDWEDFFILANFIREDDLFVLVSARKGSVSHIAILDRLPIRIERHFPTHNKLLVYPQRHNPVYSNQNYSGIATEPLSKGMETIRKLGKGLGDIFKKSGQ